MSNLTTAEITYLKSQHLGRLATTGANGRPNVVPVGFRFNDDDTIDIGGFGFATSKKARDIAANPSVAFVVDDHVSVDPWQVRMIEFRGDAEIIASGGGEIMSGFDETFIRIQPRRIVAFGIDDSTFNVNARTIP
jgi:pyridoxamine 5'-phosphate oxidase family protein